MSFTKENICYLARFLQILNGIKEIDEDTVIDKSDYKHICRYFVRCSNGYPFGKTLLQSDMASN